MSIELYLVFVVATAILYAVHPDQRDPVSRKDLAEVSFPLVNPSGCIAVRANAYSVPLRPGTSLVTRSRKRNSGPCGNDASASSSGSVVIRDECQVGCSV